MIDRFKCYVLVMLILANVLSVNSCRTTKIFETPKNMPRAVLIFSTILGEVNFQVEIADTDKTRATGLMHRTELLPLHAMLFIFESSGPHNFWMKNTPLALDLIFMDENFRIVSIISDAIPNSLKSIDGRQDSIYVLEVAAGTAKKYSLKAGMTSKLIREP